jgi:predicted transcriptional regulator
MSQSRIIERLVISVDRQFKQALSHSMRFDLLNRLSASSSSPSKLARALDSDTGTVSYHVKVLLDSGLIQQVKTEPVRGATEHFYECTPQAAERIRVYNQIPQHVREEKPGATMQTIIEEGVAAAKAGTLDAHDRSHLNCIPAVLDSEGCEEVSDAVEEAFRMITTAQGRSTRRLAKAKDRGTPTTIILANFESARTPEADQDVDAE